MKPPTQRWEAGGWERKGRRKAGEMLGSKTRGEEVWSEMVKQEKRLGEEGEENIGIYKKRPRKKKKNLGKNNEKSGKRRTEE